MSPLHLTFSVPSHLPSPVSKAVDKFTQQICIEYLLVPGTILELKENVGGMEAPGKPLEPALHFSPWLAPLTTFPHSL